MIFTKTMKILDTFIMALLGVGDYLVTIRTLLMSLSLITTAALELIVQKLPLMVWKVEEVFK